MPWCTQNKFFADSTLHMCSQKFTRTIHICIGRVYGGRMLNVVCGLNNCHTNNQQLETVQRQAARVATGDYKTTSSISQMSSRLGWQSLQHRRTTAMINTMYRDTHHLVDFPTVMVLPKPYALQETTACAASSSTAGQWTTEPAVGSILLSSEIYYIGNYNIGVNSRRVVRSKRLIFAVKLAEALCLIFEEKKQFYNFHC